MNEKDYIGMRGEVVFAFLIGKPCNKRFWFIADFLGGKAETKDFTVRLIDPSSLDATFFVQVKATKRGYSGKGANQKLKVTVKKKDIAKLKLVSGPTYVAGIDIEAEVGFLYAITRQTPDKTLSSIPCSHPINCSLIPALWKEIAAYWKRRNMLAKKSLFS